MTPPIKVLIQSRTIEVGNILPDITNIDVEILTGILDTISWCRSILSVSNLRTPIRVPITRESIRIMGYVFLVISNERRERGLENSIPPFKRIVLGSLAVRIQFLFL
jgi:hypothetical protein